MAKLPSTPPTAVKVVEPLRHTDVFPDILLGAVEKGLGGCILRSIDKPCLTAILNLSGNFEIIDVVAIGKPVETVVITNVGAEGDIKYYRDENGVHHVPKRSLDELIVN